jgi:hypothetical protein
MDRHLFTSAPTKREVMLDYALSICIGLLLTVGALAYFDVLFV